MVDNAIKVFEEPWRHLIIDDVFDQNLINEAIKEFKSLFNEDDYADTDERFQLLKRDAESLEKIKYKKSQIKNFINLGDSFDPNSLLEYFPDRRSIRGSRTEYEMMYCGKNFSYKIHDEAPNKILSCVVFLEPEENSGTVLYDENKNYHSRVEWKQNRMMVFAGKNNVTWHSYDADNINPRLTMNIFLKK